MTRPGMYNPPNNDDLWWKPKKQPPMRVTVLRSREQEEIIETALNSRGSTMITAMMGNHEPDSNQKPRKGAGKQLKGPNIRAKRKSFYQKLKKQVKKKKT